MSRLVIISGLLSAALLAAGPAHAQSTSSSGAYGVARVGVVADSDLRFRSGTGVSGTFQPNTDLKPGFIGDVGLGYDLGLVRVEGTIGYSGSKIDRERSEQGGLVGEGRARSLNLGISAYADLPVSETISPFVGAGIGASRVSARLSRLTAANVGSRIDDKDWGLTWHVDAGVGFRVASATTLELSARHQRTTKLDFEGTTGATVAAGSFRPRLSSTSVLLGLRQAF